MSNPILWSIAFHPPANMEEACSKGKASTFVFSRWVATTFRARQILIPQMALCGWVSKRAWAHGFRKQPCRPVKPWPVLASPGAVWLGGMVVPKALGQSGTEVSNLVGGWEAILHFGLRDFLLAPMLDMAMSFRVRVSRRCLVPGVPLAFAWCVHFFRQPACTWKCAFRFGHVRSS